MSGNIFSDETTCDCGAKIGHIEACEYRRDVRTPSPIEEVRQAIEERENNAGELVDVPFSLTPPVSQRKGHQVPLF